MAFKVRSKFASRCVCSQRTCAPHEEIALGTVAEEKWWLNYCPFLERVSVPNGNPPADVKAIGAIPAIDAAKFAAKGKEIKAK